MQTLHDLLKLGPAASDRRALPRDELRGLYSKIGISAVAAATQFNGTKDSRATPSPANAADRSSSRGWSRHR